MLNLKPVEHEKYPITQEKIDQFKSVKQVKHFICIAANHFEEEIDKTFAWSLAIQLGLTKNDFYNDIFELRRVYGEDWKMYEKTNWKIQK